MIKAIMWLAEGFVLLLSSILSFFGRKGLIAASVVTMAVSLTVAFVACIKYILDTIAGLIPPGWVFDILMMWIPSNFAACLAAILSANICRAAYDLAMTKLHLITSAN